VRIATVLGALICAINGRSEDLLFTRFPMPIRTVAYEMPGVPAQTIERLAASIRQNFPQAEIVDGAAANEATLRQKLAGPFLLITLLDPAARLLPLTAAPLPLKLEEGVLRWGEFSGPAKDHRVAFIGRNPYGSGNAMVLAFGSLSSMGGENSGNYSYAIRRGSDVVQKGVYDDRFAPVEYGRLTLVAATADVQEFYSAVDRIHPDPYARSSREAFDRARKQVLDGLAARVRDGKVTIEDLAYWLAYAAGSIHDGHTIVRWRPADEDMAVAGRRFPPFRVESENGRFFVDGKQLSSINGVPAAGFFAPILDRCPGETAVWRAGCFTQDQQFWFWHTNLFAAQKCCTVRFEDGSEQSIAPVSLAEFRRIQTPPRPKRTTGVAFYDSGRIAHFVYPAFRLSDDEKKRIDDVFRKVRESKSEDLLIDLRGNGGGASGMGDYIFRYLAEGRIEQASKMRVKLAPETIEDWKRNGGSMPAFAEPLIASFQGKVLDTGEEPARSIAARMGSEDKPGPRPDAFYRGRLWLLIDNQTFSSANMFSAAFRDSALGKILGSESGEPPISSGNFFTFTLKNSGIQYQISNREFFPAKPRPGDSEHGILPDVPFDRKLLAPYRDQPDPGLAFALDYIRGKAGQANQ
jgi:hypothetical protein